MFRLKFIDRVEELSKLMSFCSKGFYPILYIYGPEGCGKTRLLKELYLRIKGRSDFLAVYVDAQVVSDVREAVLGPDEVVKVLAEVASELVGPPGRVVSLAILRLVRRLRVELIRGKHVVVLIDDVVRSLGLDSIELFIKNLLNLVEELMGLGAESVFAVATTSEGLSRRLLAKHNYVVLQQIWNLDRNSFTELLRELSAPDDVVGYAWELLGGNPRLALMLKALNWSFKDLKEDLRRRLEPLLEDLTIFSNELKEVIEDIDSVIKYPKLLNHLLTENLITPITRPCLGYTPEINKELGVGKYYAWQVPIYKELISKYLTEHTAK